MDLRVQRQRKGRRKYIVGLVLLVALVWFANVYLFSSPVRTSLASDPRTARMAITAHLKYYLDPTTLNLDLRAAQVDDPADLFRGLLRAVKAVDDRTWVPGHIVLLRAGEPVYTIAGADLAHAAYEYSIARNQGAVIVAFVQALRLPDGKALPPMPVTDAAGRWAAGH
jgi:hypothetical protein